MKYAVIGSRTFYNYELLKDVLDRYDDIERIVSGGAIGCDSLAEHYAKENNIPTIIHKANWKDLSEPCKIGHNQYGEYNKLAGFVRNQQIINDSDIVICFWDEVSNGTRDSVNKAKKAGKKVIIINEDKLCQTCNAKFQFGLENHSCEGWEK